MTYLRPGSISLISVLASVLILGEIATDMFLSALPSLTQQFGVPVSIAQLTLASYMVGFALMQLAYGPISDRYGRKKPLIIGTIIFLVSSLLASQADTIEMLIVLRFFQSLGGAAGVTICLAIVRDLHDPEKSMVILARMGTIIAIAPAMAPLIGGVLVEWMSWRWTFYALATWAVIALGLVIFLVPESLVKQDRSALHIKNIVLNFKELLCAPSYAGYLLTLMFSFSTFFAFIFGAPFVFIDIFGLTESAFGLLITLLVGGFMLGTLLVEPLVNRFGARRILSFGVMIAWASGLMVAVFPLIGIQTVQTIIGPMIIFAFSIGFIFPLGTAGALAPFPHIAGVASAFLGFSQTVSGVFFGVVVGVLFDGTAIPMTTLMGIAATIGLLCYLIFFRHNDRNEKRKTRI